LPCAFGRMLPFFVLAGVTMVPLLKADPFRSRRQKALLHLAGNGSFFNSENHLLTMLKGQDWNA